MNTEDPADLGRHNDFKRSVVVVASCILSVVALYYAGGKALLESNSGGRPDAVADEQTSSGSDTSTNEEELKRQIQELQRQLTTGEDTDSKPAAPTETPDVGHDNVANLVRVTEAHQLGKQISSELSQAQSEITEWTNETTMLSKGDAGRRIAKFSDLVDQYAALVEQPIASHDDLERWEAQLQAMLPRINEAHSQEDDSFSLSQDEFALMRSLLAELTSARKVLKQNLRAVELLVTAAADTDPGDETLDDALARRTAERDAAYLRELADAKQATSDNVNATYIDKIVGEHRKQQELLNQQRLSAEKLATEQQQIELDRISASVAEIQARRAKAKLIQDFNRERAVVESLLAPFIDNAITQPSVKNPISKGGPMRPTSLGSLRASGALDETRKGLDFLYHVGGHPANMRKKGGFPSFVQLTPIPNDSVRARVKQAQQLLLKYGEVMVEEGLLSE